MHWISALQVVSFMPPRQFHAKEQFIFEFWDFKY